MLDITFLTKDAHSSEDRDAVEIHMSTLSEFFSYDILELKGRYYIQVYNSKEEYLGYVKYQASLDEQLVMRFG